MEPFDTLRQMLQPPEFRIAPPSVPSADLLDQWIHAAPVSSVDAPAAAAPGSAEVARFLAEIGTGLWRLRQKMLQPGSDEPLEEMRRAWRHFESVWAALARIQLEVQDHTDSPYHAGVSLHVVAFQPTPGVTQERIIETIRPTIYLQKQLLQIGEVIVATPPAADSSPA